MTSRPDGPKLFLLGVLLSALVPNGGGGFLRAFLHMARIPGGVAVDE
jgi:hypothetical protein